MIYGSGQPYTCVTYPGRVHRKENKTCRQRKPIPTLIKEKKATLVPSTVKLP